MKAYIDDVVIYSKTLESHLTHLVSIFIMFHEVGISVNPKKAYLGYLTVQLLGQKVDSLGLSTSKDKLWVISQLEFPRTLQQLETYLSLTGWLRNYVLYYTQVTRHLQARKTELLKPALKSGNPHKTFSSRTIV